MTALDRATVHRLVSSLVEFGLVTRDASRNYRLGIEAMQLRLAAMRSARAAKRSSRLALGATLQPPPICFLRLRP